MSNVNPPKNRGELGWSVRVSSLAPLITPTPLPIFQSENSQSRIKEMSENFCEELVLMLHYRKISVFFNRPTRSCLS